MAIRCYKCGSKNVQIETEKDKSYSIGKGLVGTALFGTGGAVMGVNGKVTENTKYVCRDCGCSENFCMLPLINQSIDDAIATNNLSFLRITKERFPNIEWEEKKEDNKSTKSYEEITAENRLKVHNYCKEHSYEPLYVSQMSVVLGLSVDICDSAIEYLRSIGVLGFHLFADVKENDDIPYKYCTDPSEIEKNFISYKKAKEEQQLQMQRLREKTENEESEIKEKIRRERQEERLILEKDSEYLKKQHQRTLELEPYRERFHKANTLVSNPSGWKRSIANVAVLKLDGKVIGYRAENASEWNNIIKIDGRFGFSDRGYIYGPELPDKNLSNEINKFFNNFPSGEIRQIAEIGSNRYLALKNDGSVVTFGDCSECEYVENWSDIKYLYTSRNSNVFGIKNDGSIVFHPKYAGTQLEDWTNIVQITTDGSENPSEIIGLRSDGQLEIYDRNPRWRARKGRRLFEQLKNESDIVAICEQTINPLILLHKSGSVSVHYDNNEKIVNSYDVKKNVLGMRRITRSYGSYSVVCIHSNGSISVLHEGEQILRIATGIAESISNIRLFNSLDSLENERKEVREKIKREEEQKREEEARRALIAQRKYLNLCPYCGGTFKGIFIKKCSECGCPKDY